MYMNFEMGEAKGVFTYFEISKVCLSYPVYMCYTSSVSQLQIIRCYSVQLYYFTEYYKYIVWSE